MAPGITRSREIVPMGGSPGYRKLSYGLGMHTLKGREAVEESDQVRRMVLPALERLVSDLNGHLPQGR